MREKKKKKLIILSLIGILFVMSAGYAVFNSNLSIKGTSSITSNWDIKITSVTIDSTSGSGKNVNLDFNNLTANMEADLYEKGDSVTYNVVIENNGTLDAKLDNIEQSIKEENEAVKISFSGYTKGQTLKKNTSQTIKVTIEYNKDYSGEGKGSKEVSITFDYNQNEGGTITPTDRYLVTYDCTTNGGEDCTSNNEYLSTGTSIELSYKSKKDGAEFIGWNTDSKATTGLTELTMGENDITLYAIFKIKILPTVSFTTTTTSNSITVDASANYEGGTITKYEFSKDNGETWIDNDTNNTYTFDKLTQNTSYNIKVRVTSEDETTATASKTVTTDKFEVELPTFTEGSIAITPTITTTGTYPWTETNGVWKSGNYNVNSSTSQIDFEFTLTDTTEVSWDWSVSSESKNYDYVYYSIYKDGSSSAMSGTGTSTKIGGTDYGTIEDSLTYTTITKSLEAGSYKISFIYRKDSSTHKGLDSAYIKNFNIGGSGQAITITYPDVCNTYTCSYIKDNEEEVIVTENTSVPFSSEGTLIAKISDGTNTVSSSYQVNLPPKLSVSTSKTSSTITLVANTTSEISKYEYSIDDGETYQTSNSNTYTFTGLTQNTTYKVKVRITSKANNINTSSSTVTTNSISTPTFTEKDTSTKVTITIKYPEGCGSTLTCSYIKDSGEEITVTENTTIEFTKDGTLVAKATDGTNSVSSSYTVQMPTTITVDGLEMLVVKGGDGLYADSTEDGRYVYKGASPDNYLTLGSDTYRIISVESDGTLKVIKNTSIGSKVFDPGYSTSITGVTDSNSMDGTRYSATSTDYCYYSSSTTTYYGCNVWGSKTTMLDSSGSNVTKMPRTSGSSTTYDLPDTEAYLNTYLNTTWYNSLSSTVQSKITTHMFNVGSVKYASGQTLSTDLSQEQAYKWKGKVGLMNATDYVKTSTNSSCTGVYAYRMTSDCYNNSATHNWLYTISKSADYSWTISPFSGSSNNVFSVNSSNGYLGSYVAGNAYGSVPVLYLSSDISLTGSGTSSDPYIVG